MKNVKKFCQSFEPPSLNCMNGLIVRTLLLAGLVFSFSLQSELSQIFYHHYDYRCYYFYNYIVCSACVVCFPLYILLYPLISCFFSCKRSVVSSPKDIDNINIEEEEPKKTMTLKRIKRMFIGSFFFGPLMAMFNYFYLASLNFVQSSVVQTLDQSANIFIIVFAVSICLKEELKFLWLKSILILISIFGIVLVSIGSGISGGEDFPDPWIGVLFIMIESFLCALCKVLYVKFFDDLVLAEILLFSSFNGMIFLVFFWPPIVIFDYIGFEVFEMTYPIMMFNLILSFVNVWYTLNLVISLNCVSSPIFTGISGQLSIVLTLIIDSIIRGISIHALNYFGIVIVLIGSFLLSLIYVLPEHYDCMIFKLICCGGICKLYKLCCKFSTRTNASKKMKSKREEILLEDTQLLRQEE